MVASLLLAGLVGCGDKLALEQHIVDLEQQVADLESASPVIKEVEVVKEVPTGISQVDYDKVVAERDAAYAKIKDLEKEAEKLVVEEPDLVIEEPMTLNQFLLTNFGTCETSLGPTSFEFDIHENDSIYWPYDYWIQVEYDSGFFVLDMNSKDVTTEMNHKVCEELKNFQERLARAVIELMPSKKFYGGYYDSWYRYPTLKVDLITRRYYSWVNYTPAGAALVISLL